MNYRQIASLLLMALPLTAGAAERPLVVCHGTSADPGRGTLRVEVAKDSGRLLASVFLEQLGSQDRLLANDGVERRDATGRDLDVLFVGQDLTVATSSTSDAGRLDWQRDGQPISTPLHCD